MALGSITPVVSKRTGKTTYRVRWDYIDANGKRIHRSKSCKTRDEAEDELVKVQGDLRSGAYVEASSKPIGPYVERWFARMNHKWRPGTYAARLQLWQLYCRDELAPLTFRTITRQHIQNLVDRMNARKLAPSTVRVTHRLVKQIFDAAGTDGLIGINPAARIVLPQATHAIPRTWNQEQAQRFLGAIDKDPYAALWEFVLLTGVRLGEVVALQWADVDLNRGRARIHRTACRIDNRTERIVEGAKTRSSNRTIPLSEPCQQLLKHHRIRQWEIRSEASIWHDDDLVFCRPDGRALGRAMLCKRLKTLCRHANMPVLSPHGLRHTAATLLLEAGEHPKVVQELLGHSSITMTLDLYSHVSEGLKRTAADRLDAMLRPVQTQQHDVSQGD